MSTTGFTNEQRNYTQLVASAAFGTATGNQLGLASDIFNDMLNNGFKLLYQNGGGSITDPTLMWQATQVVFQAKNPTNDPNKYVDPVGAAMPWCVGFEVSGFQNNTLKAYLGTPAVLGATGIDITAKTYAYEILLVAGGPNPANTFISATNEFGYRLSITQRGIALLVWPPLQIEDMRKMGLMVIQRPVKSDGTTLQDGYAPVFAVHNTDPITSGQSALSDRFFKTVLREFDVTYPTTPNFSVILETERRATGAVTFFSGFSRPLPTGTHLGAYDQSFHFTINGANVIIGQYQGPSDSATVNEVNFPPLDQFGPDLVFVPIPSGATPSSTLVAQLLAQAINAANGNTTGPGIVYGYSSLLSGLTATASGNTVFFYANASGPSGNGITFSINGNNSGNNAGPACVLSPATGTFLGGGSVGGAAASGSVYFYQYNGVPPDTTKFNLPPAQSILTLNGTDFTFVIGEAFGFSQISVGTLVGGVIVPVDVPTFQNNVLYAIANNSSSAVQEGVYSFASSVPSGVSAILNISFSGPGVEGNNYTLGAVSNGAIQFVPPSVNNTNLSTGATATLTGGTGFSPSADISIFPNEISDVTGQSGSTLFRFPNLWTGPVTTDQNEYVLVFPFGFTTQRVTFVEELDMVAVSKGAAYQGVQAVSITVYGQNRTYTSYSSNFATQPNYVRVFILTAGGGI